MKALKEIKITLEVLQKTRIGMTVNNLRKSSHDDQVIQLSKTLIKSWKRLLESQKDNGNSSDNSNSSTNFSTNTNCSSRNGSNSSESATSNSNSRANTSATERKLSFPSNVSSDVRLKCREMVLLALKFEEIPDDIDVDLDYLAASIEDAIYREFKDTNMKYKNRIRSRVSNLRDTKNPDLRQNVLRGHISPARIAVMTADEMASDEMKKVRQKFTSEAINDHQMALTEGTKSDLIRCPKCKKNNCTYNQVITNICIS